MSRILALKSNFTVARTQVEGFFIIHFKHSVAGSDHTRSAYIENTHLAAGQEIRGFQRVDSLQLQHLTHRHGTTYHHTVVHGIYHIHFIWGEYFLYKEITTNSFRIITFRIFRMRSVADLIVRSHDYITFL